MSTKNIDLIDSSPENLKALRTHLKKSQTEMGEILGLKQGSYSGLERGASNLTKDQMTILAEEFDCSPSWLLFDKGPMLLKDISTGGVEEDRAIMWLKDHDEKLQAIGSGIRGMLERIDALERRLSGPG